MQPTFTQDEFERNKEELSNSTFEQNSSKILKDYFSEYRDNFMSEEGMRATMKAWLQKAKDLKIID